MHFWSDLLYLQVGGLYFFNDKDTSMVYGLSLLGTTETSPDQLWKQAAYKLFSAESIFKLMSINEILSTQNNQADFVNKSCLLFMYEHTTTSKK